MKYLRFHSVSHVPEMKLLHVILEYRPNAICRWFGMKREQFHYRGNTIDWIEHPSNKEVADPRLRVRLYQIWKSFHQLGIVERS